MVLVAAVVMTGISLSQFPKVSGDESPTAFLPGDIEEVSFWNGLNKRFGAMNNLMVGLEEPKDALTSDGLSRVAAITRRIDELKHDGVMHTRSVINVEATDVDEDGVMNVDNMVPSIPMTQDGLNELATKIQNNIQVPGAFISHDMKAYVVMVKLADNVDGAAVAEKIINVVEQERGPMQSYYFGAAFATYQVSRRIIDGLRWVVPVFALGLFVVLFIGLRRPAAFLMTLLCSAVPLVWWMGALNIFGIPVTMPVLNGALVLLTFGAIAFARVAEGRTRGMATFLPFRVIATFLVAAAGFSVVATWQKYIGVSIPYLDNFSVAVAIGFIVLAVSAVLITVPMMTLFDAAPALAVPVPERRRPPAGLRALALLAAVAVTAVSVFSIKDFKFAVGLGDMFSKTEDVGRGVDFFDRKFGGSEILQISVKGDFSRAAPMNRLMRFSDLIEGTGQFADVRCITQILAYVSDGVGGTFWIPPADNQLKDLFFFIAGIEDVKALISDDRQEAMLAVRMPANSKNRNAELIAMVEQAAARSAEIGPQAARLRIAAISTKYGVRLPEGRADQVVESAASGLTQADKDAVVAGIKSWIDSEDSPWNPAPEEWDAIVAALDGTREQLFDIIKSQPTWIQQENPEEMTAKMVESLIIRRDVARIEVQAVRMTDALVAGVETPENFRVRARGILSSLLAGEPDGSEQLEFNISGYPAFTKATEDRLLGGLKMAALLLFVTGAVYVLFLGLRNPSRVFVLPGAAAAASATFAISGALGLNADPNSASIYLIAPLAWLFLSEYINDESGATSRYPAFFAGALAAGGASLLMFGVMPVIRIGGALGLSLIVTVVTFELGRRLWYRESR